MKFDSAQYKTTTRRRWEDCSSGCNDWAGSEDRTVGARKLVIAGGAR